MRNLTRGFGVGLLLLSLTACDQSKDEAKHQTSSQTAEQQAPNVSLLDGRLTFKLPEGMTDQTGKLGSESNNMHVYANSDGSQAVIVIVGDQSSQPLNELSQKLQNQQQKRDPQLQVVADKALMLGKLPAQQLDSVISAKNHSNWSTVILSKVDGKLVTLQISLPADNQLKSQALSADIVKSIVLK